MPEKINLKIKKRKEIRKKIVELLKGKTDAGNRVFPNASVPQWEEELPVILIYPRSETAEEYAIAPRELERDISLAIEIVAKGPEVDEEGNEPEGATSLEDILDNIAEQVEAIMAADDTLGCTADNSILKNTEFEFEAAGGLPIGSCRLTYSVTYFRPSPDLQPELPAFKNVDADWRVGHNNSAPDSINEANDLVDIPQT